MIDYKLVLVFGGIELFLIGGGTWCALFGIKNGFIERRMKRGGEVFTGADAVGAGVVYILIALLCGTAALALAHMWFEGRVHW